MNFLIMQFACKKISLKDVLKCSFNINKTSFEVLIILIKSKDKLTIIDISKKINLTSSSVQKAIKNLINKELINRIKINKDKGGYFFKYYIKNKKGIKELLIKNTNNWAKDIIKRISKL